MATTKLVAPPAEIIIDPALLETVVTFYCNNARKWIAAVWINGQVVHTVARDTESSAHDAAKARGPQHT